MKNMLALLVVSLILAGCTPSRFNVTYTSDPMGAYIISNGQNWGQTPVTLTYDIPKGSNGVMIVPGITCRWASGATFDILTLTANYGHLGTRMSYTCQRPLDAPGLDTDINIANQLRNLEYQQKQTELQEQMLINQYNSQPAEALDQPAQVVEQPVVYDQSDNGQVEQQNEAPRLKKVKKVKKVKKAAKVKPAPGSADVEPSPFGTR